MEQKTNKLKLTIYLVIAAFIFYITSVFTSIIDPSFGLEKGFCKTWDERYVGEDDAGNEQFEEICVEFKDNLSEQMYYYNSGVQDRRFFWLIGQVLVSTFIMIFITKLLYSTTEEKKELIGNMSPMGSFLTLAFTVLIVGSIGSLIFSWILPKPASYLPFITYQLDRWEEDMKYKIKTGEVSITSKGEVLK